MDTLFVSYTHADRRWAEWIAWVAEAAGHEVTIQAWDIAAGDDFMEAMQEALTRCDRLVAVLSPDYLASKYCRKELWPALADDKVTPLRVGEVEPEGLLKTLVYADLVGRSKEAARRLVEKALAGERLKPDTEPVFPPDRELPADDATTPSAEPVFPGTADALEPYRRWALDRYGHVELIGLGAGDFRFDLDEVYVPLRISQRGWRLDPGLPRRADEVEGVAGDQDVALDGAFALAKRRGRELAFFGDPGAGKTTVLRKLLHQTLTAGPQTLGLAPRTLPFFLRLRQLEPTHLKAPLAAFLQRSLDDDAPGRFPDTFAAALWRRGDLLLLLDGLDEIASTEHRAAVCRYLDDQLAGEHDRGIRAVVSSRHAGVGGSVQVPNRFLPLDVRKLDDPSIHALVRSWFQAAHRARTPDESTWTECDAQAEREATELIERLGAEEYSSRQILELISTPLLVTLLCIVVLRGGDIPRRRTKFYGECLTVLLGRWSSAKDIRPLLEVEDALTVLGEVALHLHEAGRRFDLTLDELATVTAKQRTRLSGRLGREIAPDELLDWLHRGAAVFSEYAAGEYGFAHLGLQEYLAATEIAKQGGDTLAALARRFGDKWWREVTLLVLGLPGHRVFAPFMQTLIHEGPPASPDLLRRTFEEAHEVDIEPFLGALVDDALEHERRTGILRFFVGRKDPEVGRTVLPLVTSADEEIAGLARQLAVEVGLTLPAAAARKVAPAMEVRWVEETTGVRFLEVPGGEFQMGSVDPALPDPFKSWCVPVHGVVVSNFLLAETPVTNRQYTHFIRTAKHREPELWRDSRFNAPDQPVVGVSWEDAVAFASWLSDISGRQVRLPTEAEWERAARDADERTYPWGEAAPTSAHADFGKDWDSSGPSPVGAAPEGRGPYGHLDLAGNVWEWCADRWDEKAYSKRAKSKKVVPDPLVTGRSKQRALRGGGWDLPADYLRSAYRDRDVADYRDLDVGFRVAVSSPSTMTYKVITTT